VRSTVLGDLKFLSLSVWNNSRGQASIAEHYGAFTQIFVAVAVSREIRPATNKFCMTVRTGTIKKKSGGAQGRPSCRNLRAKTRYSRRNLRECTRKKS
jgi:hypothetical protein